MALRQPSTFGARGDGKDDAAALQRMLDAAKPGDVCRFPRKPYRLSQGLRLAAPDVTIEGNGATLVLDTSDWPDNRHLAVGSARSWDTPTATFTADVPDAMWLDLPPRAGWSWLALGTDPHDGNEEHYGTLVGPDESRVWVPQAVNGSTHRLFDVPRVCERVTVRDLRFEDAPGQVSDCSLEIHDARHVTVQDVTGRVNVGVQISDSEYVTVTGADFDVTHAHQSSGRPVSLWQSRNVVIDRTTFRSAHHKGEPGSSNGFFLESNCRRVVIDRTDAVLSTGVAANSPLFMVRGGCRDVVVPFARVTETPGIYVDLCEYEPGTPSPRIDVVEVVSGHVGWVERQVREGLTVGRVIRAA